jgi:alpha-L-fucosidase
MKYFVITTRHHDGFSIWPTEYSDYNISATPYQKDVLLDLKNACQKQNILFGTYYSICDWKHPYYPLGSPGGKTQKETGDMKRFLPFIEGQTKELIEKYDSKILWFDGEWESPWTHEMGLNLYDYLKELNKNILINNRVDKGRKGMEGITISDEFAGDFATPEQQIGRYDAEKAWESCITICQQWAWKPNDKLKSLEECLHTLIKTVGGGGNLLLNVGPMPDGRIEPRQAERLKEMGNWLNVNREAIYGTRAGPYIPNNWLASTQKDNKLYLFLMNCKRDKVELPIPENIRVISCKHLNHANIDYVNADNKISFKNPSPNGQSIQVLELELSGNTENFKPVQIK